MDTSSSSSKNDSRFGIAGKIIKEVTRTSVHDTRVESIKKCLETRLASDAEADTSVLNGQRGPQMWDISDDNVTQMDNDSSTMYQTDWISVGTSHSSGARGTRHMRGTNDEPDQCDQRQRQEINRCQALGHDDRINPHTRSNGPRRQEDDEDKTLTVTFKMPLP